MDATGDSGYSGRNENRMAGGTIMSLPHAPVRKITS